MKTKMLIFFLAIAINAKAQFKFSELDIAKVKESKISVDLKVPGDITKMKVIIEETPADEEANLTLVYATNTSKTVASRTYDPSSKKLIFELSKEINDGIVGFELRQNDSPVAKIIFALTTSSINSEEEDDKDDETKPFESYIGALASANFIGNNKFLSNLTPVVNLGGISNVIKKGAFSWDIEVNPYIGSEIDTKDSVSFMPAMMLYGKAGITLNNFFNFRIGKKVVLNFMPIGFGMKFIPNLKDSSNTVIQHNIRTSLTFSFDKKFMLSAQYTHGWHNMTSQSESNFKKIFGNIATDISYLTVTGHFGVPGKNSEITNYLFMEWRGLLSRDRYAPFTNNRILTIGIKKTLELRGNGISGASTDGQSGSGGYKLRHGL